MTNFFENDKVYLIDYYEPKYDVQIKMMKRIVTLCLLIISYRFLHAQDYPQWPARKPDSDQIKASQSKQIRLDNSVLPQEIAMQDKMRIVFTEQMKYCAEQLGWDMVELLEYTNDNAMQGGGTPYALRSPRGIEVIFQFIVNRDYLRSWKKYQADFDNDELHKKTSDYSNIQSVTASPRYKEYHDSVNYYMNLYLRYVDTHKNEGAALFTKDKYPKHYQQKENEFINKMTAMTEGRHEDDEVEKFEGDGVKMRRRFRNHAVVELTFHVNNYTAVPIEQVFGAITFTSVPYPKGNTKVSRLFTVTENENDRADYDKWNDVILMLLGSFRTRPNEYGYYDAGFNHNDQGDEHTPKKILSDQVQNISILIRGDKENIKKIAELIDVNKLNDLIYKN